MKKCQICIKKVTGYNERYDAYYCKKCMEWLENACDDPKCEFCPNRPEKAEVK